MHEVLHRVDYGYSELHIAFTEKSTSIFEGSIFKRIAEPKTRIAAGIMILCVQIPLLCVIRQSAC